MGGMPSEDAEFYTIDLFYAGPNLWAHNAVYEGNRSVGVLGRSSSVSNG